MKKGMFTTEFWVGLGSSVAALEVGMQDPAWQVRGISVLAVAFIAAGYAISRARVKSTDAGAGTQESTQ